jgi:flagellar biosynthesis chaperone FliJ
MQSKEYDSAMTVRKALSGVLVDRRRAIENLHNEIMNLENNIEKGSRTYREKCEEIERMNAEVMVHIERNAHLKHLRERMLFMEHENKRLDALYTRETHKHVAITDECTQPRNVHRWLLYGAIDPAYSRSIQYLSKIYGRINEAQGELVELTKERDDLIVQCGKKQKECIPTLAPETNAVSGYIERYKSDIAAKDKAIEGLASQVNAKREEITEVQERIDKLRGRVTSRKSACSQLRQRNLSSKSEKRRTYLFMTEPAESISFGGGFVQRVPEEVRTNESERMKILTPETLSAPSSNRRQKNQPVSKGARTILRPLTVVGMRKRPGTSFGPHGD